MDVNDLKSQLINHSLYESIKTKDQLRKFMEYHVFAVWDFMSLLKTLQNNLTCTSIPWVPKGTPNTRYLINEIVIGEESDVDQHGIRMSHFEIYLKAMKECECDTQAIEKFVEQISSGKKVEDAMKIANVPNGARAFVNATFETINSNQPHVQAAVFTFGREDLIPDMFLSIVREMQNQFPDELGTFLYYLERHIEVDGGHHSHLATSMTDELIGDSEEKRTQAESAVRSALKARINLWNAILEEIEMSAVLN
jgi:hypothetical protein